MISALVVTLYSRGRWQVGLGTEEGIEGSVGRFEQPCKDNACRYTFSVTVTPRQGQMVVDGPNNDRRNQISRWYRAEEPFKGIGVYSAREELAEVRGEILEGCSKSRYASYALLSSSPVHWYPSVPQNLEMFFGLYPSSNCV